jgi:hypothetical protein
LHDNAWPHASLWTKEAIVKLCWSVLLHPPYDTGLAPSDFHLFEPPKKKVLYWQGYCGSENVISTDLRELRAGNKDPCFQMA